MGRIVLLPGTTQTLPAQRCISLSMENSKFTRVESALAHQASLLDTIGTGSGERAQDDLPDGSSTFSQVALLGCRTTCRSILLLLHQMNSCTGTPRKTHKRMPLTQLQENDSAEMADGMAQAGNDLIDGRPDIITDIESDSSRSEQEAHPPPSPPFHDSTCTSNPGSIQPEIACPGTVGSHKEIPRIENTTPRPGAQSQMCGGRSTAAEAARIPHQRRDRLKNSPATQRSGHACQKYQLELPPLSFSELRHMCQTYQLCPSAPLPQLQPHHEESHTPPREEEDIVKKVTACHIPFPSFT
jgi:hypothetical protein